LFEVQLVGQSKEVKVANGVFSIHTDAVISEAQRPDLIIIPALSGNLSDAISLNQSFLPWIRQNMRRYRGGKFVFGSIFIGINRTSQWQILFNALVICQ
jgi:hypothetical protein